LEKRHGRKKRKEKKKIKSIPKKGQFQTKRKKNFSFFWETETHLNESEFSMKKKSYAGNIPVCKKKYKTIKIG
jgi:hypothetical protein